MYANQTLEVEHGNRGQKYRKKEDYGIANWSTILGLADLFLEYCSIAKQLGKLVYDTGAVT